MLDISVNANTLARRTHTRAVNWHVLAILPSRLAPARQVGGTRGNAASSRSHCVFTAVVESRAVEGGLTSVRASRLHLVDLAGRL